jgi:hypothetical protein
MLSMPDDNESQPQDAVDQDAPASSHDGAAHGVPRTDPKGKSGNSKAPTVFNPLTQSDHGVQHLTSLLDKSASDLDLEVIRLKSERAEMKKEKKRVAAQLRNTERKRRRLCSRAKTLSTNDLLEVYAMRVRAHEAKDA